MIGVAKGPLQVAAYGTLNADATLAGLVAERIYESVPDDASYPFVVVRTGPETPDYALSTHDSEAATTTLIVTVYDEDRGQGAQNVDAIVARIHALFHRASIAVTGFGLVDPEREFISEPIYTRDEITKQEIVQVVIRFRFRLYEV